MSPTTLPRVARYGYPPKTVSLSVTRPTQGCGCPVDTSAEGRSTDRSDS
nr:MAG TPA: hypothetical protein [Caudoviricetes sp.]